MIMRRSVNSTEEPGGPAGDADAPGEATAVVPEPGSTDGAETAEAATPTGEPDPDATAVRPEVGPPAEAGAVEPDAAATAVLTPDGQDEFPTDGGSTTPPKKKRRGRRILLGVGIAVLVLAGVYVAAAFYLGDRVPQGTTVAGVDISGMTSDEAVETLNTQLADVVAAPIPVEMGEAATTIEPAAAGLELDAEATVDAITGFTLDPSVVFGHMFGMGALDPVVVVDDAALTEAVTTAATELDLAPVDGAIEFADGEAEVVTEPEDGLSVDVPPATELLATEWLTGERPFQLPSQTTEPTIGDDAVDAAMSDIAEPLLSAPVTVELNDDETSLEPEQLAAAATIEPDGSELVLVMDGDRLAKVVSKAVPSVGQTPQDAKIVLKNGKPTIIPAVTGTGLQPDQLADVVSVAAVATDEADRVAVAELEETQPEFSTQDAKDLRVSEIVSEFSTPFPYDPPRTANLVNGAANISGTLILPGEEFSLIEALGPITAANGYGISHVVDGGFVTNAMGGGLSQISTTTFNAAFEAGMEDITHKPHSRWFDRYPAGRESTLFAPSLDMVWGNNTPYGVMVQAWVDADASRVYVRLWSTEYWDVDIVSGEKYSFTEPKTVYNESDTCEPESGGASGFSIDVSRTVSRDGEVSEYSRDYSWTYAPWNKVVCGSPPSEDEEADKDKDEESSSGEG